MIPILYDKRGTEKLAILNDCIECYVEEERNGPLELTMVYPNDESALHLLQENIIVADVNDTLKNQQFRIYEVVKLMSNELEVTARHISFDLAFDVIDTITIENQSCEYALNTIFRNSQFCRHYVGHSDIINAQDYSMQRCTCQEAIYGKKGSIIDTYGTGAEILRDNTDIHVLNKRGNDNGVTIEYSKNLTGFELEEDASELVTRIIPYAKFKEADAAEETTLWVLEGVDSPLINNYSHPYVQYIDYSSSFEQDETPTQAKLIEKALNEFNVNNKDKPKQNFKIEFIPLSKCVGFEGLEDAISLCDTVTIKDSRFNLDTKAKVIKTTYDVLRDRYESMELGEPRTSLGDIISNQDAITGPAGPAGPQGPAGADGSISDFPDSLPDAPILTAKVYGFASIELNWTYENKAYYNYEIYASTTEGFTPNTFDLIHAGQTSSFLFQAEPNETWYFRACAVNSYGRRTEFSDEVEVVTTKIDDLENYFTSAAIGQAVVGSLSADYMEAGIIKGHWVDAKNLSVTDGNGRRTLDIDSFGNVTLNVTSLKILSSDVVTEDKITDTLVTSASQYYLSTSLTELVGGSWEDTAPPWTSGKYMWQRMKYTYRDGSVGYSTAVCIAGAQGEKGEDGKDGTSITVKGTYSSYEELISNHPTGNTSGDAYIIDKNLFVWDGTQFVDVGQFKGDDGEPGEKGQSLVSSTPQWYLSTSKTTQTGGNWVDTMPALVETKYLWLRYKLVWENPSSITYTNPTLEQIAESVKQVIEKQATFEHDMDGFKSTVSATYATKAQVSTVSTTASNALTTANNATQTADQANNTANQANTKANTANTNATNALNKANTNATNITTIQTKQSSLEQTVNGFKTEVSNTYVTKGDASNTYATKSLVTQTASDWTAKFNAGYDQGIVTMNANGITVQHSNNKSVLDSQALKFYEGSTLKSKVDGGIFKFTDANGVELGQVGCGTWAYDRTKAISVLKATYGHSVALSAPYSSTATTSTVGIVHSSHDHWVANDMILYKGLNMSQPIVSGMMNIKPQWSTTMQDYNGSKYGHLTLWGYTNSSLGYSGYVAGNNYLGLGVLAGNTSKIGLGIYEDSNYKGGTRLALGGPLQMNGWSMMNARSTMDLNAQSRYTKSLLSEGTNEHISYGTLSYSDNEIRWCWKENVFTYQDCDVDPVTDEWVYLDRYICYIELPIFMAENIEADYHINVSKMSWGDWRIREKNQYYFILESEENDFAFTFEVVAKLKDGSTIDTNSYVANDSVSELNIEIPQDFKDLEIPINNIQENINIGEE